MKPRLIVLLIIPSLIIGLYFYRKNSSEPLTEEMQNDVSMAFLDALHVYESPQTKISGVTEKAFNTQNFTKLESLAKVYADGGQNPGSYLAKRETFYYVICDYEGGLTREQRIAIVEKWEVAYPESISARLAHAGLLISYAWDARTSHFASEVTRSQFEKFHSRLQKTLGILQTIPQAKRNLYPQYYANMIACSRGLGVAQPEFDSLYRDAVLAVPRSVNIHFNAAHFSTLQWGGEPGEWEINLRKAISGLPKNEADQVYADTILRMVTRGHWFSKAYNSVFKPAKIDTARLIHGIRLLIDDSPENSPRRIFYNNALALIVMEYENDPMKCRDALKAAGWKIDLGLWGTPENFDYYCREWLKRRFQALQ